MRVTKINPIHAWVIGWAHLAHAVVMIFSGGLLSTRLPFRATLWSARRYEQAQTILPQTEKGS